MLTNSLSRLPARWPATRAPSYTRLLAAAALRATSRTLGRLARQLAGAHRQAPTGEPVYEFYAEAGAPEGALYVDGQLVGHVPGVTRL